MLLTAVGVQEQGRVSVADAGASVEALEATRRRLASRSRRLSAGTLLLLVACSVATIVAAIAVTGVWVADALSLDGKVVADAADAQAALWVLALTLGAGVVLAGVLEHRASRAAVVAGDGARVVQGLAVEVIAVRAVLATGVTNERRARAAASLRYSTADGQHPHEKWALRAARLIEETHGFGRATVRETRAVAQR